MGGSYLMSWESNPLSLKINKVQLLIFWLDNNNVNLILHNIYKYAAFGLLKFMCCY